MPTDEAVQRHFSYSISEDHIQLTSGFVAAIRDARLSTGRDVDSGIKVEHKRHGSWLGALGYMALPDQVGKRFKPRSKGQVEDKRAIVRALRHFTNLGTEEIDAIYALRCGFAHDYSLVNINAGKPELTHHFLVYNGPGQVVTLPRKRWDGDYSHRTAENQTRINLEALGDLVEGVCAVLHELAQKDDLEIVLSGGSDELLRRYHFGIGEITLS
jgi:hypothetical protein